MKFNRMIFTWVVVPALVAGLLCAKPAQAHKVTIFAWVEGDVVYTQSKFMGSRMVQNGRVEVKNSDGKTLLEGKTDAEGLFTFTAPYKGDFDIVLHAGPGHQAVWHLGALDFEDGEAGQGPDIPVQTPNPPPDENTMTSTPPREGLTESQVTRIVSDQLHKEIEPLKKMLARSMQPSPSLQDILGGIGYILGLVGIAAYVQSRRRSTKGRDDR